jgi:putative toxin-antitoxin system antitoxin component (TIGR02293 family)
MSQATLKSKAPLKPRRRPKVLASTALGPATTTSVRTGYSPRTGAKVSVVLHKATKSSRIGTDSYVIAYQPKKGVDDYVRQVAAATPIQIVEIERTGVRGSFIKDLSKRMNVPVSRIVHILGVPKSTVEKKAAAGEMVTGHGGQAAIGMVRLLGIAQGVVRNSTASEARGFDAAKWLGQWIERPQPSLGGRKPADLLDTSTGIDVVARLLGSIESGAYQ